jgi:hypothetical protein
MNQSRKSPRLERGKPIPDKRLRPGQAQAQIHNVTEVLKENLGRWHVIHKAHCRPEYLYQFNRGKGRLDERITLRYATQVRRGESDVYYAMILNGGVVNAPKR